MADDQSPKKGKARTRKADSPPTTPVGDTGPETTEPLPATPEHAPEPSTLVVEDPQGFQAEQALLRVRAPEVDDAYRVIGRFQGRAAQAQLLLCEQRDDAQNRVVVKLFHDAAKPEDEPRKRFASLNPRFVARYVEPGYGTHAGQWWEVVEYLPLGDLRQFAQEQGGRLTPDQLTTVIDTLTEALAHFHSQDPHIIHRDIKPTNVLVRSADPLEVVVTDFGSAAVSDLSYALLSAAPITVSYTAPEAVHATHRGQRAPVTPSRDWWSLGMTIAELAGGRHPYQDDDGEWMEGYEVQSELGARPVPLDHVEDDRVRLLIRGLLTRNPDHRWTEVQVRRWLAGESPDVKESESSGAPTHRVRSVPPPPGLGVADSEPEAIARLLADDWDQAAQIIAGRYFHELVAWVEEYHPDCSISAAEAERTAGRHPVDRTVAELVVRLGPDLEPTFMGIPVDVRSLHGLDKRLAKDETGDLARIVDRLFSSGALLAYARLEGHGDLVRIEAKWSKWCEDAERWFRDVREAGDLDAVARAVILREAIEDISKTVADTAVGAS